MMVAGEGPICEGRRDRGPSPDRGDASRRSSPAGAIPASPSARPTLAVTGVAAGRGIVAVAGIGRATRPSVARVAAGVVAVDMAAVAAVAEHGARLTRGIADREQRHRERPIEDTRRGR